MSKNPEQPYTARELRLSLVTDDDELYPYTVVCSSLPPDDRLICNLSDKVYTDEFTEYSGGGDPTLKYHLRDLDSVIKCCRSLARNALKLTSRNYPDIGIVLDDALAVNAREILDDNAVINPPRLF